MKSFILSMLFVALVAVTMADEKIDVMALAKACQAETKATEKEVTDFWEPNVNFDNVSPNMKCHLKCVMEKMGHLKGGAFDAEKAAKDWKEVPELKEFKVFEPKAFVGCKNEKGENDCETALKINKCVRQFKA